MIRETSQKPNLNFFPSWQALNFSISFMLNKVVFFLLNAKFFMWLCLFLIWKMLWKALIVSSDINLKWKTERRGQADLLHWWCFIANLICGVEGNVKKILSIHFSKYVCCLVLTHHHFLFTQSRKTCTHLLRELQNYNLLLNNHRQDNVEYHQKRDTTCPRAKEKPQQDGRRGKIMFIIKPHTCHI